MLLNTLFQKITAYPCPQFCAPHLIRQGACKFYAAFFPDAEILQSRALE